jgi:hypothetical protein
MHRPKLKAGKKINTIETAEEDNENDDYPKENENWDTDSDLYINFFSFMMIDRELETQNLEYNLMLEKTGN